MIPIDWVEKRIEASPLWEKILVFILFPQIAALVVTGFSITHIWRSDSHTNERDWFYMRRSLLIWILALGWFYTWWLILFPILSYFVYAHVL